MTHFIDTPTHPKNTEFKIHVGRTTESKPTPCKILAEQNDKVMIEYQSSSGKIIKWINKNQIIEKE